MDLQKCTSFIDAPSQRMAPLMFSNKGHAKAQSEERETVVDHAVAANVDIDPREIYFLIMHFLSAGPCQRTVGQFWNELLEHQLLPRRYHAWYSRSGALNGHENDDGVSFPLNYDKLVERYAHVEKDHLVKLLKQLMLNAVPTLDNKAQRSAPSAVDVPTLLGAGFFSLLTSERTRVNKPVKPLPAYMRWPHMQVDQVRGLALREIGGGFQRHHRAPSVRLPCYTIAKPSTMVQKMQEIKKLRGHRDAVYCAIFDRSGRFVITGSDDRLVKIWSMETAFCLASCRGHEGDITDLAVSSNNFFVASASNDYSIRVWRLPDGFPISVLRGHIGAVTAIAFSPRPSSAYHLLSSSDDGTCRIWDARSSDRSPRVYLPKPTDGKSNGLHSSNDLSSSSGQQCHRILCCAYNANGNVFVTGSSDTFARVWKACNFSKDDERTNHEIDVLAGHENDVNYVQFSCCAVAPRSSSSDSFTEDNKQKFKNSWFTHDNIVTCSRDGSAIIWVPRSRKSHGTAVRWMRAYHLKVPPPPMPPRPPKGGPRQRLLPTPRGVNMIVWSLDNRFVLAAIMDCRICVWNARDGSLVHSLTGHSESTYVLDVHPFNPRIAMSAGYDGKTIIWDIWEGTPIKIYEIGRFKLVDGKFSPDGTSVVLSDDAGQIYLLNTGQGEAQKDAKYDQFFLGDYRPLIQDALGNVIDQETQLPPYIRNIQDSLCDSSMMPYPEPYQSMYQRHRLGAMGKEWRPTSIKFAVGRDIGLGQEILPLADLDRVIEPLPEFLDAIYWEPENEVVNEDTDSEYNVTEDYSSGGEQGISNSSSSIDQECSSEDDMAEHGLNDGLRRSKRRKEKAEVKLITSSGRCVKRKNMDEHGSSSLRIKRMKKQKLGRKASKRKSSKLNSLRPQRVAARNALSSFSQFTVASTDEDESFKEDASSDSEAALQDSNMQRKEPDNNLEDMQLKDPKAVQTSPYGSEDVVKPRGSVEPQLNTGNRKRLVVKFSLKSRRESVTSENTRPEVHNQADLASSSTPPHTLAADLVNLNPEDPGSSSAKVNATNTELSENCSRTDFRNRKSKKVETLESDLDTDLWSKGSKIRLGEVPLQTPKHMKSEDLMPLEASNEFSESYVAFDGNRNEVTKNYGSKLLNGAYREEERFETGIQNNIDGSRIEEISSDDVHSSLLCVSSLMVDQKLAGMTSAVSSYRNLRQEFTGCSGIDTCRHSDLASTSHSGEFKENLPSKPTKIRIKSNKNFRNPESSSQQRFSTPVDGRTIVGGDLISEMSPCMKENLMCELPEDDTGCNRKSLDDAGFGGIMSNWSKAHPKGYSTDLKENSSKPAGCTHDPGADFAEAATDAMRRTRSMKLKATSRETYAMEHEFRRRQSLKSAGTSRREEKLSKKIFERTPPKEWMTSSEMTFGSGSSGTKGGVCCDNDQNSPVGRKLDSHQGTSNWLMLSEQEEGYRYIPQLGDQVVYLRQGHQEYLESSKLKEVGPWERIKKEIRAVEFCSVEGLDYSVVPGSGDSCCKIKLRFTDPSSHVLDKAFTFTLCELSDFPDFVVERTWYEATIRKKWSCGDKCLVWWRDGSAEGGRWWEGEIVSLKDKSNDFPGSPWERYSVQYYGDPGSSPHNPWELHDPDSPWEHPHIDEQRRDKLLVFFYSLQQSVGENKDRYGILRLNEIAQKLDFINRFPVSLSPDLIALRLKKNYYRSLEAVKHDMEVMMSNAQAYSGGSSALDLKLKRLSESFRRKFSKLQ